MKKTRYYPFERNRYFYGKLLTVRDFESEQKYFNDKRRMMNRLLFGAGVVSGLQVIAVDDKSVSVEMGAAIDALGREIVVPAPVTLKLSMMDGFTNNEYAKNVYLCLAYDEKGKEPVHSIANSSVRSDEVSEYNRVLESYRLFIREDAPAPSSFPHGDLLVQTAVLYEDEHVRVLQEAPRVVGAEDVFELVIRIEKSLQSGKIELSGEWEITGADALDSLSFHFSEPQEMQETAYIFRTPLRVNRLPEDKVQFRIKPGSTVLKIGDRQLDSIAADKMSVPVIAEPVAERLMSDFLQKSLEASLESPAEPCLYLARIGLLQVGPTYVIERVEQVPFGEYVYNASAFYRLARAEEQQRRLLHAQARQQRPLHTADTAAQKEAPASPIVRETVAAPLPSDSNDPDVRTGTVGIAVSPFAKSALPFGKAGRSFVSAEIEHGFGAGQVLITASVEEQEQDAISDLLNSNQRVYFGAADVFAGSEYEASLPEYQLGVVTYPQKGTFRIGIKLRQAAEARTVRLRWWAYRAAEEAAPESAVELATLSETAAGAESGEPS